MTGSLLQQAVEYDFSTYGNGTGGVVEFPVQLPFGAIIVDSFTFVTKLMTYSGPTVLKVGTSFNKNLFLDNFNLTAVGATSGPNTDLRFMDNTLTVRLTITGGTITAGSFKTVISFYFPINKALGNIPYVPIIPPAGLIKATLPEMIAGIENSHYTTPALVRQAIQSGLAFSFFIGSNAGGVNYILTLDYGQTFDALSDDQAFFVLFTTASLGNDTIQFNTSSGLTGALPVVKFDGAGNYIPIVANDIVANSTCQIVMDTGHGRVILQSNGLPILSSTGWGLTGNAGTNSAINYIGTTDAIDWVIRTTSIERLRVLASGNIGIGITIPTHRLQITGSTNAGNNAPLQVDNDSANCAGINLNRLVQATQANGIGFYNANVLRWVWGSVPGLDNIGYYNLTRFPIPDFIVDNDTGNVGIKVTTPAYDLDVNGSAQIAGATFRSFVNDFLVAVGNSFLVNLSAVRAEFNRLTFGGTALFANSAVVGATQNIGIESAGINSTLTNSGIVSAGAGGTDATGVRATASGASNTNYGVYGQTDGNAIDNAGVYGVRNDTNPGATISTAVYGSAFGSANNVNVDAGYFDARSLNGTPNRMRAVYAFAKADTSPSTELWAIKAQVDGNAQGVNGIAGWFECSNCTNSNYAIYSPSGKIGLPNLQVGNAGLLSGDVYVDTAANVLLNGDLVLARKV